MKFIDDTHAEELSFEVNVISLVDILFLLVIFFAVTTTFSNENGVAVNLPQSSSAALSPASEPITISLAEDSSVFLAGKPVKLDQLLVELQRLRASSSPQAVAKSLVIRADKRVSHGEVVAVMEAAKGAGLEEIAFATEGK